MGPQRNLVRLCKISVVSWIKIVTTTTTIIIIIIIIMTTVITQDTRETVFLFQRVSIALQRVTVVSFLNTMNTE